jgi:hypothetical protein
VAGAAVVSKTRCEVNAAATRVSAEAFTEASRVAVTRSDRGAREPARNVLELIVRISTATLQALKRGAKQAVRAALAAPSFSLLRRFLGNNIGRDEDNKSGGRSRSGSGGTKTTATSRAALAAA